MKEKNMKKEVRKQVLKTEIKENVRPPKSGEEFKEAHISEYIKRQRLEKLCLGTYTDDLQ